MSDSDSDGSDSNPNNGLTEVFELMKPYVSIKTDESYEKLLDLLNTLGVSSMSHLDVLTEADFSSVIKVADFRLMMKKIQGSNSGHSTNTSSAHKFHSVVLKNIIPSNLFSRIKENDEIMTKQERNKVVQAVADDIRENSDNVTKSRVLTEARKLVNLYPTAFGCLVGDTADKAEASEVLKNSIMCHIKYIHSENRRRKSNNVTDSEDSPKVARFTKSQNYALPEERDLPNELQDGETPETREAKRKIMVDMASTGEAVNFASVKKLMMETYCSQRRDIHRRLIMEKLLQNWPYIGNYSILLNHFEFLMNIELSKVREDSTNLFSRLDEFFRAETNRKRKGAAASIPSELKKLLKTYDSGEKSSSCHYITLVLCCMTYMKVPLDSVFMFFTETTSYDEVQGSELLPDDGQPMIALLGNDPQLNPKAYVVCESRCISEEQVSCSKALNMWFMSHFVFKYSYNTTASPILEFLQRKYFGIVEPGTRKERKKTAKGYSSAPPDMSGSYLLFMKAFKEYCSTWNVEL